MTLDIWAVWPTVSIERSQRMTDIWHAFGYQVAVLINPPFEHTDLPEADRVIVQKEWEGFPTAANILCHEVPGDIVIALGDDVYPDPDRTAQEIGEEMAERFPDLNGVLQPTGDEYGWTHKCAVSPWIGRRFIEEVYGGKGPYWPGYFHYFSDQELQEHATNLGMFQQRPDLIQYHDHWQRRERKRRPKHLRKAKRLWTKDRALFQKRKREGFSNGTD